MFRGKIKSIFTIVWMTVLVSLSLNANPFLEAGEKYQIDPWLLYSIAKVESNVNPIAFNKNKNGTFDIGVMQINTIHKNTLIKNGGSLQDLWSPQTNIMYGAWVLRGCMNKHGYTTKAIDCYNGDKTGKYSQKVIAMYQSESKKW